MMKNKYLWILVAALVVWIGYNAIFSTQEDNEVEAQMEENVEPMDFEWQRDEPSGFSMDVAERIRNMRDKHKDLPLNQPDRVEWMENFPFEPTYSDAIPFDKEAYDRELNTNEDMIHVMGAFRHGFMKDFYENPSRYSRPFQQIWEVLESEGLGDDPMAVALIFNDMDLYHHYNAQDPDEIYTMEATKMVPYETESGIIDFRVEKGPQTNGEWAAELYEIVAGNFQDQETWPGREYHSDEEASRLRDLLFEKVDSEGFLEHRWLNFAYNGTYEEELQHGDSLLVK